MILACDPATKLFGLAVGGERDGNPRAWAVKLPGAEPHVLDRTLCMAAETVRQLCIVNSVQIVAIESPIMPAGRSAHTALALIMLTGAIRAAAHRAGCSVQLAAASTVRKHFVGSGFPAEGKHAVMARCRLLGWDFTDHNAADAAALWSWAMSGAYPKWSPKSTPLFREKIL